VRDFLVCPEPVLAQFIVIGFCKKKGRNNGVCFAPVACPHLSEVVVSEEEMLRVPTCVCKNVLQHRDHILYGVHCKQPSVSTSMCNVRT
jgi:hypothetical protein